MTLFISETQALISQLVLETLCTRSTYGVRTNNDDLQNEGGITVYFRGLSWCETPTCSTHFTLFQWEIRSTWWCMMTAASLGLEDLHENYPHWKGWRLFNGGQQPTISSDDKPSGWKGVVKTCSRLITHHHLSVSASQLTIPPPPPPTKLSTFSAPLLKQNSLLKRESACKCWRG